MPKISYQTLAIIIVGIIGFIFAMRIVSPEDTWICQEGKWVKHGNPSTPKPIKVCRLTRPSP